MSEASELLKSLSDVEYESYSASSPVNDVIEIDANGRFINIPRTEVLLGVETDKDVERKYFRCPRIVGDNIDLTKLQLRVNYQNADQEKDAHIVQDVTVDGQYINFSWKLSDKVLAVKGTVFFAIQAVSSEQDGTLKNRWNTTLASGTVLETLIVELDYYEEEQARELLTELLQMMDNKSAESIQKIQKETNTQLGRIANTGTQQVQAVADEGVRVLETIPADYQETYKMADEGIRTKVYAITDGVESQDTIVLTNAANDPLRGLKLYGKTKQATTNGYQLFDASRIPTTNAGGATVTNNGDGSFTVSGSGELTDRFNVNYSIKNEELKKLFKTGTLFCTKSNVLPYLDITFIKSDGTSISVNSRMATPTIELTEELLNSVTSANIYFYGYQGQTIVPGTIKPMVYQDGDGTWESFSGGIPGPNPDYPQELDSLGEMGNLFNKDSITDNSKLYTGDVIQETTRFVSDYIDCKKYTHISINLCASFAWYDNEFNKVSSEEKTMCTFRCYQKPTGARYVRLDFNKTDIAAKDVMVVGGEYSSDTMPSYRPYTGQKEIESRVTGKNLLPYPYHDSSTEKNGGKINIQEDGSITFSGTPTDYIGIALYSGGSIITDKFTVCAFGSLVNAVLQTSLYDVNSNTLLSTTIEIGKPVYIDVNEYPTATKMTVGVKRADNNIPMSGIVYPMIVAGNVAPTQYEPYAPKQSLYTPVSSGLPGMPLGQTIPDVIKNSPAHMSGVYWDEEDQQYYISDTVDYENGKYVERIKHLVLTGKETWYTASIDGVDYIGLTLEPLGVNDAYTPSICTHCKWTGLNGVIHLSENDFLVNPNIYFAVKQGGVVYTNVVDWKAFLSEEYRNGTPLTVQYILATPTTRDLTATEMSAYRALRANKPTTVIFNDCKARMGVKYNVDLESKMDENAAEERHESDLSYSNSIVQNVSGEKLLIQDSSKAPLQGLKMYGKTKRATTNGHQLFDASKLSTVSGGGITITNNGDGSFTVSGSGNVTENFSLSHTYSHEETVKLLKAGTLSFSVDSMPYPYFFAKLHGGGVSIEIQSSQNLNASMEITEEMLSNKEARLYVGFYGFSGKAIVPTTIKPMLYQDGDGTYEPYTGGIPSPNPNYPQELNSLGKANGQIESVVNGKNLFVQKWGVIPSINDGIDISSSDSMMSSDYILVDTNKDYVLSTNVPFIGSYLFAYDIDKNYLGYIVESGVYCKFSTLVTKCPAVKYVRVRFDGTEQGEFQFEQGSAPTTYEPYHGQSLTTKLPNGLPGIEVTDPSLATYTDEDGVMWCADEVDYENGKYVQRILSFTTDGSSDEQIVNNSGSTGFGGRFIITLPKPVVCGYGYCNKAIRDSVGEKLGYFGTGYASAKTSTSIYIVISQEAKTVEQFRKELGIDPSEFVFILATPIIHDLTPEQMKAYKALRTNHPTTIITNDCDAYMDVKYNVDLEIKMDADAAEERYESDLKYGGAIVQTIQGESLVATDSAKAPFLGMKLFGKTEQFTTTGKNLLNNAAKPRTESGITFTVNEDKSVTANGTATAEVYLNLVDNMILEAGQIYVLSGTPNNSNGTCSMYTVTSDLDFVFDNGVGVNVSYDTEKTVDIFIKVKNGSALNNVTFYPMLRKAEIIDATYEPYTGGQPSPSPDYPQELKSAGQASGQIESGVLGGNLCQENIKGYFGPTASKIIIDNDAETFIFYASKDVTYTFGADVRGDRAFIGYSDSIPNHQGVPLYDITELATNSSKIYTFTSKHNAYVCIYYNYTRNDDIGKTFRVNVGDTLLPYEPYKQPQSLITPVSDGLSRIKVADPSLATYTDQNGGMWCADEVFMDYYNMKVITTRRFKSVDLGSLDWILTNNGYFQSNNVLGAKNHRTVMGAHIMCDIYKHHGSNGIFNNTVDMAINVYGAYIGDDRAYVRDSRFTNATDLKNAIRGHILLYELKTPIVTERDLTQEELKAFKALRSNYPTTTIMNDANAHMEASYVVDTKTYIDKKFAELAARLSQ